jgi:hypothetical protein
MNTQKHDERAFKETTHKDHTEEVFPKGPLGPILGAPKQYESLARAARAPAGGDRVNPNGQILSEAEILCDAAKKYCPEAVPEIDAVFKLATYP